MPIGWEALIALVFGEGRINPELVNVRLMDDLEMPLDFLRVSLVRTMTGFLQEGILGSETLRKGFAFRVPSLNPPEDEKNLDSQAKCTGRWIQDTRSYIFLTSRYQYTGSSEKRENLPVE